MDTKLEINKDAILARLQAKIAKQTVEIAIKDEMIEQYEKRLDELESYPRSN